MLDTVRFFWHDDFIMGNAINTRPIIPARLLGKPFGPEGLQAVQDEIAMAGGANRAEIARRVCHRLHWKTAGGQDQLMSMRVGLLKLQRAGLITLPPPLRGNGNGGQKRRRDVPLPPGEPVGQSVEQLTGLMLQPVVGREQSWFYSNLIEHYHYLGYTPMAGAQVRYLIRWEGGVLGAIGFGAAAWKVAPRDLFIGWVPANRERNLHLILNNSRFLILPWVRSANLASKVLRLCARRIPGDFQQAYGYAPVLLETFVERNRFRGDCYRAANWWPLGQTQGRGKQHRRSAPGVPVKDVWVYPLTRHFRRKLLAGQSE
jgi:hypothetical protein